MLNYFIIFGCSFSNSVIVQLKMIMELFILEPTTDTNYLVLTLLFTQIAT